MKPIVSRYDLHVLSHNEASEFEYICAHILSFSHQYIIKIYRRINIDKTAPQRL